mmetsp:Transcript_64518/g.185522  ORF Transcript_64518/g.185522 Transcript_64518/m.185522 type:complete len:205 (-) Transcript_64518:344-958(-)
MRFRDVRSYRDTIASVPSIRLNPAEHGETSGLPTIASVVLVDTLDVGLSIAVPLEDVHNIRLHRLRSVHDALGADINSADRVVDPKRHTIGLVSTGLVEALFLDALQQPMDNGHAERDWVLVVGVEPGLDLPDALGVLADDGGAVPIWSCIELLHLRLLKPELWCVDLDGVDPSVPGLALVHDLLLARRYHLPVAFELALALSG